MKNTLTAIALGTIGIVTFIQSNDTHPSRNLNNKRVNKDSVKVWALDSLGNALDSGYLNQSNEFKFPHLKPGVYNVKTKNFKTKEVYAYQSIDIAYPNKLMKLNAQFKNVAKRIIPKEKMSIDSMSIKGEPTYSWSFGDETTDKISRTKDMSDYSMAPGLEMSAVPLSSGMATREKVSSEIRSTSPKTTGKMRKPADRDDIRPDSKVPVATAGSARVLTAGIWNDLEHWDKFEKTHADVNVQTAQNTWGIYLMNHRYGVEIYDQSNKPVIGEKVSLKNKEGQLIWEAQTDNRGKAELWYNPNEKVMPMDAFMKISIVIDGKTINLGKIKPTGMGYDRFNLSEKAVVKSDVDVCFVVDATGSMGDEINYLKEELMDVMMQFQQSAPCSPIRLSSVFYKDYGDDYVTRKMPFVNRIDDVVSFVSEQYAGGGGDFPEAVQTGLDVAVNELDWNEKALTKIIFLILDAPPHDHNAKDIQALLKKASAKGIKIIPITASGINQSTEFCMKYLAAGTGGDYIYITDHSGVGGSHIKPTGVKEDVDLLNTQILKALKKYSQWEGCKKSNEIDQPIEPRVDIFGNNQLQITAFPNPATDYIKVKTNVKASQITVTAMNGKLISEIKATNDLENTINVGNVSDGLYILTVILEGQAFSNKFFVNHSQQAKLD
jgi:Mg-chelatase subunit ChlD